MIGRHLSQRFPGDHPRTVAVRRYLLEACSDFVNSGLADGKFVQELTSGSDAKFWASVSEALVAQLLGGKTFGTRIAVGEGPDFLVMDGSRRVWIEVVWPEPIDLPADWRAAPTGVAVHFPHLEILLRWTSAIKAKVEKLIGTADGRTKGYLETGLVSPDDAYVIAVNGCQLRSGPFPALTGISQFPFAAEAVFPIGPYQLQIDRRTLKVVESGHQHRLFVMNKNGSPVPAHTFLDPRFSSISAIWALDLNGGSAIGNSEPKAVVHNPNANISVNLGFLPADSEYIATPHDGEFILERHFQLAASDG